MMHEWSTMKRLIYLRGNPATGGGGGSPLTVTGATPLLMPGAVSKPLRKATFAIEAVQSGSGDPSPSNVRPITGWTGCTAWVTGNNLYPYETINEYTYAWYSGSKELADATNPFFLKGGKSYVLSYENSNSDVKLLLRVWRQNGSILEDGPSVLNAKMLSHIDAYKFVYSTGPMYYNGSASSNDNAVLISPTEDIWVDARTQSGKGASTSPMLTPGTTASPYTPYSGSTVSVEFPDSVGTIYSGTIDPVTGQGVVTYAKLNFDDFPAGYSWVYQSQYSRFYYTKEVAKGNGAVMSDIFKSGYDGVYTDNMGRIFIGSSTITDLETFTSTISGHYIVYELPTPIPFTVPPQTLTPPAGDAYIWADCGTSAEVTYIGKA